MSNATTTAPPNEPASWIPIYIEVLQTLSLVASLATISIFLLYRRVFYRSLNVIWVGGAVSSSVVYSVAHIVSGISWISDRSVTRSSVTFCTLRVIADGVFLTAMSLFLFIYYAHIQVIKRRDEVGAMAFVKYYFLVIAAISVGLFIFLAVEVPRDFNSTDGTCVTSMTASSRTIMYLLPLTIEVVSVMAAATFVTRLAMVSASKGPMFLHLGFLTLMLFVRIGTFVGSVAVDDESAASVGIFVLDRSFTCLIGLMLSGLFIFSERVPLILQFSWSAYDDGDDHSGINGSSLGDDSSSSVPSGSRGRAPSPSHLEAMSANPTTSLLEMTKRGSLLEEYYKTSLSGAARTATDVPTGEFPI